MKDSEKLSSQLSALKYHRVAYLDKVIDNKSEEIFKKEYFLSIYIYYDMNMNKFIINENYETNNIFICDVSAFSNEFNKLETYDKLKLKMSIVNNTIKKIENYIILNGLEDIKIFPRKEKIRKII